MVLTLLAEEKFGQRTVVGRRLGVKTSFSSSLLGVPSREKRRVDAPPYKGGRREDNVRCEEGVAATSL
jgi:hypothetical protein